MSMPALFKGRLSLPVIAAPLFIISVPDLVIAQCKAGIVGSFPALSNEEVFLRLIVSTAGAKPSRRPYRSSRTPGRK